MCYMCMRDTRGTNEEEQDWSSEEDIEPIGVGHGASEAASSKMDGPARPSSNSERLPLELILEICRNSHPKELLAFSRLNKRLRKILTSKKSINIWRSSWATTGLPPPCAPDQSEMQWAQLITESDCTVCWKKQGVRNLHYPLRLRICQECIAIHLVSLDTATRCYPHLSQGNIGEALFSLPKRKLLVNKELTRMWSRSAFVTAVETIQQLRSRQDSAVALREFNIRRRAEKDASCQGRGWVHTWLCDFTWDQIKAQRKALAERLIRDGHHEANAYATAEYCNRTRRITEKQWEALKPRYEQWAARYKANRVEEEQDLSIDIKQQLADALWEAYKAEQKELDPFTPKNLYDFSPFTEIIHSDEPPESVKEQLKAAMVDLPQHLAEWRRQLKVNLLNKLAQDVQLQLPDPSEMTADQVDAVLRENARMNLAFTCPNIDPRGLVLFQDLVRHECLAANGWTFSCLVFNSKISDTIFELATLAGSNPKTATRRVLDRKNVRYACQTCVLPEGDRLARSWRNCIEHLQEHSDIPKVEWELLSPSDTIKVIECENLSCKTSRMICLLCPQGTSRWNYRNQDLERHFKKTHKKPLTPEDYFADHGIPQAPIEPVRVPSLDELETLREACYQENLAIETKLRGIRLRDAATRPKLFRCRYCKDASPKKAARRFDRCGIACHARDIHNIENVTGHRDEV